MSDCTCNNFPATLGTVTFESPVAISIPTAGDALDVAGGYVGLDNGTFASSLGLRFRNSADTTTPTGGGIFQGSNDLLTVQAGAGNRIVFANNTGGVLALLSGAGGGAALNLPAGGTLRPLNQDATTALQILTYGGRAYVTFDSSHQRVGIGTMDPQNALDVNGGVALGSYAGVYTASVDGLIVPGPVGIGTAVAASTSILEIAGAVTIDGGPLILSSATANADLQLDSATRPSIYPQGPNTPPT